MADSRPTFDPQSGEEPLAGGPTIKDESDAREIVSQLNGYKAEAEAARRGGENPRDDKWRENLDLYWNRYDFSNKAQWQARETLPEVPAYVDRFASALKEAMIAAGPDLYTIVDPKDTENDLGDAVKRMTDVWLTTTGRSQNGNILGFPTVFEEQMKLGALMAVSSVTTWKTDIPGGRVAIEAVDPRKVWLDHTFRNLYRIRRIEVDKHELREMAKATDGRGDPLFNIEAVDNLVSSVAMEDALRERERTGGGAEISTPRQPIVLDEYLATVVGNQGEKTYKRSLFVVANNQHLIRGPEVNPFWHGKDWLTYAPLVTVPLSVYGRSYMEDFGALAKTFNTLTNLILDAVFTSSLKAWAIVPGMLVNPAQVQSGLTPNKLFLLEDGYSAKDFAAALEMGTLPAEAVRVWQMLKQELGEVAYLNSIGMGQFAPNSRTSASEITATQSSSSAIIRAVAETVETRWLDPQLDLVWKTGLQHVKANDATMKAAAGDDMFAALFARRKELISRPITFQAQGISVMIQRGQALKALLSVFQIIGSNQVLAAEFMKKVDIGRFIDMMFQLSNIDKSKLQASDREKMIQQITQPLQQLQQMAAGAQPGNAQAQQVGGEVANTMGVGQ